MPVMDARLLVAAAENDVIGRDGALPWHLTGDLKRFAALTRGHAVVMGRRTHDSIVARLGHPLPGRRSIVVSRSLREAPGVEVVGSPRAAVDAAGDGTWFVLGGATVYAALLPVAGTVELTRVHAEVEGDTRMPPGWLDGFTVVATEPGPAAEGEPDYTFLTLARA